MEKKLLIIFVKNAKLGKVKTRLAKSIGDEKALEVYNQLVEITEKATQQLIVHKRVYFSEEIIEEKWQKTVGGNNLAKRESANFKWEK